MDYQILLFYKFVPVADAVSERDALLAICKQLDLKGRIIVAPEGINGTVSGLVENCDAYRAWMDAHPLFGETEYKIDPVEGHAFGRLSVKARAEIVTLGHECEPWEKTGRHLEPAEFKAMLETENPLILDIRNDYEFEVGRFKGAVRPDVKTFKEFPDWLRTVIEPGEERPILTYCTGGIRCEKLTAYLVDQGIENVYQLHGGIVTYGKDPETQGEHWEGVCYVFDDRVTVPIGPNVTPVTRCLHCGVEIARFINCASVDCNRQFTCCEACEEKFSRSCSEACIHAERRREENGKLAIELRSERIKLRRQAYRARRKERLKEAQCAAKAALTEPTIS